MKRPWALPLAPLYAAGAALRWTGLNPKHLAWPVISIGNLSAGGTGKTPFTIALAKLLTREGFHIDVLSRGYGRIETSVERADPEGTADRFGDEPLLIARQAGVPVYVGSRRFEAGARAEREAKDVRGARLLHLLDDGFQHRQLARLVDIVLVNSEDLHDWLLPAGNLREPLSALRRASVFAVPADDDAAIRTLRARKLAQPIWRFRREMEIPQVAGPVAAFCGIARPEQFFRGLEEGGVSLVARQAFRDHHRFSVEDLRALGRLADRSGATALVTTEKDWIRIRSMVSELGNVPLLTADLGIILEDEAEVLHQLRNALADRVGDSTL